MKNAALKRDSGTEDQPAFCIYINTLVDGPVPSIRNGDGYPFVFATRNEAEREIAENAMDRLQEYLDGEREFDDAMTVEEYVVDVVVYPDGSISDEDDNFFGKDA